MGTNDIAGDVEVDEGTIPLDFEPSEKKQISESASSAGGSGKTCPGLKDSFVGSGERLSGRGRPM